MQVQQLPVAAAVVAVWLMRRAFDPRGWSQQETLSWIKAIEGVTPEIAAKFAEQEYTGNDLLLVKIEDLEQLGVSRLPLRRAIMTAIEKLQSSHGSDAVLIEKNPYCVAKIIDQLRLRAMRMPGAPPLLPPSVSEEEREDFACVLEYFFPGIEGFITDELR